MTSSSELPMYFSVGGIINVKIPLLFAKLLLPSAL